MATSGTPTTDASLAWRQLLAGVATAMIGTAAVLAALMFFVAQDDWWRGYLAATLANVLAAGASLVPLRIGLTKSHAAVMSAFMVSTGVRAVLALGVATFAVAVGKYPALPTLLLVVPYYFALLGVETWILVRTLRK